MQKKHGKKTDGTENDGKKSLKSVIQFLDMLAAHQAKVIPASPPSQILQVLTVKVQVPAE